MGVDLRGRHINMPKQILHAANIGPALEQMGGKTVAQRVGVTRLFNRAWRAAPRTAN